MPKTVVFVTPRDATEFTEKYCVPNPWQTLFDFITFLATLHGANIGAMCGIRHFGLSKAIRCLSYHRLLAAQSGPPSIVEPSKTDIQVPDSANRKATQLPFAAFANSLLKGQSHLPRGRKGKSAGGVTYGYDVVRSFTPDGQMSTGERIIN